MAGNPPTFKGEGCRTPSPGPGLLCAPAGRGSYPPAAPPSICVQPTGCPSHASPSILAWEVQAQDLLEPLEQRESWGPGRALWSLLGFCSDRWGFWTWASARWAPWDRLAGWRDAGAEQDPRPSCFPFLGPHTSPCGPREVFSLPPWAKNLGPCQRPWGRWDWRQGPAAEATCFPLSEAAPARRGDLDPGPERRPGAWDGKPDVFTVLRCMAVRSRRPQHLESQLPGSSVPAARQVALVKASPRAARSAGWAGRATSWGVPQAVWGPQVLSTWTPYRALLQVMATGLA